jgi:antitoxin MazE
MYILAQEDVPMKVSRWGNSLAVRLPKGLVETLDLSEGDEVDIRILDQRALAILKAADEEFLARLRALQRPAPADLSWTREEANAR